MAARPVSLDDRLTVGPDVVMKQIASEAVVLDLASGLYFGLDETSSRLWSLIVQHGSLRAAYESMLAEFDVDADRLAADVLAFASQLTDAGLAAIATR